MSLRRITLLTTTLCAVAVTALVAFAQTTPAQRVLAEDLPPRPTAVPTAAPEAPAPAPQVQEPVAYIELQAAGLPAEARSVVQWQGPDGAWYDVDGWQQSLGPVGSVRWAVYPRDFGSGPFRWAVTGGDGVLLAVSAPFQLPTGVGQWLFVTAAR